MCGLDSRNAFCLIRGQKCLSDFDFLRINFVLIRYYPGSVLKVDDHKRKILVHFDGWKKTHDRWYDILIDWFDWLTGFHSRAIWCIVASWRAFQGVRPNVHRFVNFKFDWWVDWLSFSWTKTTTSWLNSPDRRSGIWRLSQRLRPRSCTFGKLNPDTGCFIQVVHD